MPWQPFFGFLYMGCTLPGEYECTVRLRRRCGLMSNYFDHLFKVKKVKIGFLYSTIYLHGRTRTARFTISEVAVDWQEPMVLRRYAAYALPALTDIGPADAASKHTTAPNNHTGPSPRKRSPDGATPNLVMDIQLLLTTHLSTSTLLLLLLLSLLLLTIFYCMLLCTVRVRFYNNNHNND